MKIKYLLAVLLLILACGCILVSCDETPPSDPLAHEHAYGGWIETKAPSCGKNGTSTRTCACGATETKSISATGAHAYNTSNVCTVCETALEYTPGLSYTRINGEDAYALSGMGLAATTDVVVPYFYMGLPVMGVANGALKNESDIISIALPPFVRSIGEEAFYMCTSLQEVVIPNTVTEIGASAFYCCVSLKQITVPALVESVGARAFLGCVSLEEVVFVNDNAWYAGEQALSVKDVATNATMLAAQYANFEWSRTPPSAEGGGGASPEGGAGDGGGQQTPGGSDGDDYGNDIF